jgi:hypothetical protein
MMNCLDSLSFPRFCSRVESAPAPAAGGGAGAAPEGGGRKLGAMAVAVTEEPVCASGCESLCKLLLVQRALGSFQASPGADASASPPGEAWDISEPPPKMQRAGNPLFRPCFYPLYCDLSSETWPISGRTPLLALGSAKKPRTQYLWSTLQ